MHDENIRVKVIRKDRTFIEGPDPDDVKVEVPPHYSKGNFDLEYRFPMGWSEIEGIASRTDYDLTAQSRLSGKELKYFDDETKESYTPYVVEPAMGVDRAVLVALLLIHNRSIHRLRADGMKNTREKLPEGRSEGWGRDLCQDASVLATSVRPSRFRMMPTLSSGGRSTGSSMLMIFLLNRPSRITTPSGETKGERPGFSKSMY